MMYRYAQARLSDLPIRHYLSLPALPLLTFFHLSQYPMSTNINEISDRLAISAGDETSLKAEAGMFAGIHRLTKPFCSTPIYYLSCFLSQLNTTIV